MKYIYRITADIIWVIHFFIVLLVLFGWAVLKIWPIYFAALIGALVSEIILGYCFVSKWEFYLRKKINPELDYDYSFTSYYTYKFTHQRLSNRFVEQIATLFLVSSIIITVYFRFFYR